MINVHWTRRFTIAHKSKPDWNKGIHEILVTMRSDGVFNAGIVYFDEHTRKPYEAFFRLEQFVGASYDEVWAELDEWVDKFFTGTGGFEYVER